MLSLTLIAATTLAATSAPRRGCRSSTRSESSKGASGPLTFPGAPRSRIAFFLARHGVAPGSLLVQSYRPPLSSLHHFRRPHGTPSRAGGSGATRPESRRAPRSRACRYASVACVTRPRRRRPLPRPFLVCFEHSDRTGPDKTNSSMSGDIALWTQISPFSRMPATCIAGAAVARRQHDDLSRDSWRPTGVLRDARPCPAMASGSRPSPFARILRHSPQDLFRLHRCQRPPFPLGANHVSRASCTPRYRGLAA